MTLSEMPLSEISLNAVKTAKYTQTLSKPSLLNGTFIVN